MSRAPLYEVSAFKLALKLSQVLPRPLCRAIGSGLGRSLARRNPRGWDAILSNLSIVSGKRGPELQNLCRRNVGEFGRMMADYFYCTTASAAGIRNQVEKWEGMSNLEAARSGGRGTIIITAHLGNWELGALILALDGFPMTIVTLEEPSTELTRWRSDYRRRLGIKTITLGSDKFAFVEMIATLRRNELLAMLVDRPYDGSGAAVEFFGRPTEFSSGPALLHQHTGAAIVPAFVVRDGGSRYRSFIQPAIESDATADVAANTQLIASRFEGVIRQYPEQWFNYDPIWPSSPPAVSHPVPESAGS